MIPLAPLLLPTAHAGTVEIAFVGPGTAQEHTLACPAGMTLVGGGMHAHSNHEGLLAITMSGSETAYRGRWRTAPGADPGAFHIRADAVCTDDTQCLHRFSKDTAIDANEAKELTLHCPQGTFAIGGGYEIHHPAEIPSHLVEAVEVYESIAVGLFAPHGWRVRARKPASIYGNDPWGLEAELRCVQPSVFEEVSDHSPHVEVPGVVQDQGGYWYGQAEAHGSGKSGLLSVGSGVAGEGGLRSLGSGIDYPDECFFPLDDPLDSPHCWTAQATVRRDTPIPPISTVGANAMYAQTWLFEDALEACRPALSVHVPPYFEIGAEIWFGLVAGGGGMIFLPGQGPVPVDPAPFQAPFDALPVVVVGYDDRAELDARFEAIHAELDAERTPWLSFEDAAQTLGARFGGATGVVFVVPDDEADAVAWLSDHREALSDLTHATVVAFERGGQGFEALESW